MIYCIEKYVKQMRQFDKNQRVILGPIWNTVSSSDLDDYWPKAGIVTGLPLYQYIYTVYIKAWLSADVRYSGSYWKPVNEDMLL